MATRNFYDELNESGIMDLKIDDVFYEIEYGMKLELTVCEEPKIQHSDEFSHIVWKAKSSTGEVIPYMVTKGMLYYGPRIYRKVSVEI